MAEDLNLKTIETVDTQPFKKLVMTIGELPTSFVESMTYYELLAWFTNYLQTVIIPTVNNNAEAVEELQKLFTELHDYVENYFDNLDVQEEINHKLDEMAEQGELTEIIGAYLQTTALWCFDTVADMKLSQNLIADSYARTLGFYSVNDGGGAIYKISDTGTANGMDIIACGDLYANLIYGKEINVKQIGAYGDDTHDDSSIFTRACNIASTNNVIMFIPKAIYKLTSQVTLKHIVINCLGTIDNDLTLKLGAYSSGSTTTSVYIYRCNDVQIEGAKDSYFNLEHAKAITLYADGDDLDIKSIAYNQIDGVVCEGFTINGINEGWINENRINIKRCRGDLLITGDGSYNHNNNRFYDICIEGSTRKIQLDVGHDNFISYRGENLPSVIVPEHSLTSFGNKIVRQINSVPYRVYSNNDINANTTLNFVGYEHIPTAKAIRILDINTDNVKRFNNNLYINNDGLIAGNWVNEFVNSNIDPTIPFTLIVKSDITSQRVYITCYDENDEGMEANVRGTIISYDSTNKRYSLSVDTGQTSITYVPTEGVTRIKIEIGRGTHSYSWAIADVYTPFLNEQNWHNEIRTDKRFVNNAPNNTNHYWELGDVVYKASPEAGGNIGWVCVETGNPGTWKAFGTIEA